MLDEATSQPTGCAAAGYTGCCTGDNCKTDSGCYCDVKCYYFHNCCDDITAIGCYRKCAIQLCTIDCYCEKRAQDLTPKSVILWKKCSIIECHSQNYMLPASSVMHNIELKTCSANSH